MKNQDRSPEEARFLEAIDAIVPPAGTADAVMARVAQAARERAARAKIARDLALCAGLSALFAVGALGIKVVCASLGSSALLSIAWHAASAFARHIRDSFLAYGVIAPALVGLCITLAYFSSKQNKKESGGVQS